MASYKIKQTLQEAASLAAALKERLLAAGFKRVAVVGSIRRRKDMVGDIDMVIQGDMTLLQSIDEIDIRESGNSKATFIYAGHQINVINSPDESWGAAIFYLTGPARYQIAYRVRAKRRGMRLNQLGLFDAAGQFVAGRTEEEIYEALDKKWKAPEMRGR